MAQPERLDRHLRNRWRRAFTGSRRFGLVGSTGFDGELFGEVSVTDEHVEVDLYVEDTQGGQVAAAFVTPDKGLFPPDFFGPDVTAELAGCAGLVDAGRLGDARQCYEGVRAGALGDAVALEGVRAGLERVAGLEEEAVGGVRDAIGRGELGEAREGLKRLRGLNAGHPQLGELEGEIAQAELLQPGKRFRDCPECPELVVVPEGSFMMGSPSSEEGRRDNEGPVHRVRIEHLFAVGVKEVTVGEYRRFVSARDHASGDSCFGEEDGDGAWLERSGRDWRNPGFRQTDDHPVVCVSWDDTQAYVDWLSRKTGQEYRLLGEAEWEYVARAGTGTRYWWGDEIGRNRANCKRCGSRRDYEQTSPVGSFSANGFGLHDVHGNVWEWVEDCWNDSYDGAPSDGSAWKSGDCSERVLRGGSWNLHPKMFLRSAIRTGFPSDRWFNMVGFRVARTLTP